MYRAKDNGRNRVEYYAEELEAKAVAHVGGKSKPCVGQSPRTRFLSTTNPLLIWPKVESWGGSLARIQADDGSLVHPATFIGVAETSGLVTLMGNGSWKSRWISSRPGRTLASTSSST